MPRNKKNEAAFLPGSVVAALALLALLVPPAIGYVWFKDQVGLLGDQVKDKEVQLARLERDNRARQDQLAMLCLPETLEKQVKSLNLGLGPPAQSQIIRLTEWPANKPGPSAIQRQAQANLRQRNN